jgi:hypothetical protein
MEPLLKNMILKMNFNFNIKDILRVAERQSAASQMGVTRITRGNVGLNGLIRAARFDTPSGHSYTSRR